MVTDRARGFFSIREGLQPVSISRPLRGMLITILRNTATQLVRDLKEGSRKKFFKAMKGYL